MHIPLQEGTLVLKPTIDIWEAKQAIIQRFMVFRQEKTFQA
jgi:hypothetical protein